MNVADFVCDILKKAGHDVAFKVGELVAFASDPDGEPFMVISIVIGPHSIYYRISNKNTTHIVSGEEIEKVELIEINREQDK